MEIEGSRGRLFADVGVEGPYLDFNLQSIVLSSPFTCQARGCTPAG